MPLYADLMDYLSFAIISAENFALFLIFFRLFEILTNKNTFSNGRISKYVTNILMDSNTTIHNTRNSGSSFFVGK